MNLYEQFLEQSSTIADLESALSLFNWDLEVMLPRGAASRRAYQISTLAGFKHEMVVKELYPLLQQLQEAPEYEQLDALKKLNVQQALRNVEKDARLPKSFVSKLARTCSEAQQMWEQAKEASDFGMFEPHLKEIFDLKKQEADYYGYEEAPYDALLDTYEPGMKTAQVSALFEKIKPELKHLLETVNRAPQVKDDFLSRAVKYDDQLRLGRKALELLEFDFDHGRIDTSTHPFTTSMGMEDVRITTRVEEQNISMLLFSSIHEHGHALYEQGLQSDMYGLPGGQPCSLSIHESQSRIWENNVARGPHFWQYFFKEFASVFKDNLRGLGPEDVFRAVNQVKPSLIRIMADELTYHFHILLRFEIERDIINGEMEVHDIPEAWSSKVQEYLGLEVPSDDKGELQDIHWSIGAIGYFPTYSLGSFYAAQFFHFAQQEMPGLNDDFAKGNYAGFKAWLSENIYQHGRLYNSNTLCEKVTGQGLDTQFFMDYLRSKLSKVYAIELQA